MQSLIRINELEAKALAPDSYVIFGGSFDPIHQGHVNALRQLLGTFTRVLLAVTEQNPWKDSSQASPTARRDIVRAVITYEKIPFAANESAKGVSLSNIAYRYADELVQHYRSQLAGNLFWAVGEDLADSIKDWRNWSSLNVPAIVVPIDIPVHSTNVREGQVAIHPGALDLVKQHQLYGYIS